MTPRILWSNLIDFEKPCTIHGYDFFAIQSSYTEKDEWYSNFMFLPRMYKIIYRQKKHQVNRSGRRKNNWDDVGMLTKGKQKLRMNSSVNRALHSAKDKIYMRSFIVSHCPNGKFQLFCISKSKFCTIFQFSFFHFLMKPQFWSHLFKLTFFATLPSNCARWVSAIMHFQKHKRIFLYFAF